MLKKKTKKLNILILVVAIMIAAAFSCFASEENCNSSFRSPDFLQMTDESYEFVAYLENRYRKEETTLRQDFIYGEKQYLFAEEREINQTLYVETYNTKAVNLQGQEVLLGYVLLDNVKDSKVTVTLRYSANSCLLPVFETKSGELVGVTDEICNQLNTNEEGLHVWKLELSEDDLSELSYYSCPEYAFYILKPVTTEEVFLYSITNESDNRFYSLARVMSGTEEYKNDSASVLIDGNELIGNVVELSLENGVLELNSENNLNYDVIHTSLDTEIKDGVISENGLENSENARAMEVWNFETGTNFVADVVNLDEDLPEEPVQPLEEGDASILYTDSYLFAARGIENHFYQLSGTLGLDYFANIYGLRGYVTLDMLDYMTGTELIGTTFEEAALPAGTALLKVAKQQDVSLAGQLKIRLYGDQDTATRKVTRVASPSQAEKPAEEEDVESAGEEIVLIGSAEYGPGVQTVVDSVGTEADSNQDTADAASEEAAAQTAEELFGEQNPLVELPVEPETVAEPGTESLNEFTNETETTDDISQVAREVAFVKPDGSVYLVKAGITDMSDAFLKKASYCAVDEFGTVVAVYNEHGRLVELAEGCEEDSIASYILLPAYEDTADGAKELEFAEISFTYNDVLAETGEFASLIYVNEEYEAVDPDMTVSTFVDVESYMDLLVAADAEADKFSLEADAVEAQVQVEVYHGYTLTTESTAATEVTAETVPDAAESTVTAVNTENSDTSAGPGAEVSEGPGSTPSAEPEAEEGETAAQDAAESVNTESTGTDETVETVETDETAEADESDETAENAEAGDAADIPENEDTADSEDEADAENIDNSAEHTENSEDENASDPSADQTGAENGTGESPASGEEVSEAVEPPGEDPPKTEISENTSEETAAEVTETEKSPSGVRESMSSGQEEEEILPSEEAATEEDLPSGEGSTEDDSPSGEALAGESLPSGEHVTVGKLTSEAPETENISAVQEETVPVEITL